MWHMAHHRLGSPQLHHHHHILERDVYELLRSAELVQVAEQCRQQALQILVQEVRLLLVVVQDGGEPLQASLHQPGVGVDLWELANQCPYLWEVHKPLQSTAQANVLHVVNLHRGFGRLRHGLVR